MKKVMSIVMAVVMVASMLMMTGCNSKTKEYKETVKTFKTQIHDGASNGYIEYVRYGVYGSGAYEYCVDSRNYHLSLGEIVTEIDYEIVNGEGIWFFYAAKIAE